MVLCKTCSNEIENFDGHFECRSCRYAKAKKICPECQEALISGESERCPKCSTTGSNNGNWKGGRTYHKRGYRMIRVDSHPRVNGKRCKYVFEHVLVMEDKIGRYLEPDETVHHKNGVKDDNRIENLELWTTSHPNGCRAEDLLRWAEEIIARYGGD